MHIYGAQIQAKPGRGGELSAALGELRDVVSAAIDRPVYSWAVVAGAPTGSFAISTRAEGTGDLIDTLMTMNGNEDYQKLASNLSDLLAAPSQTSWMRVLTSAGDVGDPKPVTVVTTATVAVGHVGDAMAWSHEMTEYAAGLSGMGTMLATSAAGSFFDVAWISGAESGAAVDEANERLMADAGYLERMDNGDDLFVDGTVSRMVMARLP